MIIIDNYDSYLSRLRMRMEETDVVFSGEWSVLKVINKYNPQGVFFVLDLLDDKCNAILLQVISINDSVRITQAYELGISPYKIAENLGISEDEKTTAVKWWNLCYYRNQEGQVVYDEYYDKMFAANGTEKLMADFREELKKNLESLPKEIAGNNVYVIGDYATFNPLIYELQQLSCQVIPVFAEDLEESEHLEERLLQLRDEKVVPYCNGIVYKMKRITSEGTIEVQAECKHPYAISLPCEDLNLDTYVIGNYTLKKILPQGKVCKDYICGGHEFMYLEQTLYADLFSNTILKSINSEDNDSKILLNEFTINCIN